MIFNGKTVLITGVSGFIGGWLSYYFCSKNATVIGLDNRSASNTFKLHGIDSKALLFEECDIRDFRRLKHVTDKYPIDFIFHTAAISNPRAMLENPLYGFEINIQGSWNILEIARNINLQGLLLFSSERVYESNSSLPFKEKDSKKSLSLYGASKVSVESIASAYAHTFGLPVVTAVCANIYGGADLNFNRLVPSAIMAYLKDHDFLIRGNGKTKKDFLYIKDLLRASEVIIANAKDPRIKGNSFNIGTGAAISTFELANMISYHCQSKRKVTIIGEEQGAPQEECLSIDLIKNKLNWTPSYSLEKGLVETIQWYKGFIKNQDIGS